MTIIEELADFGLAVRFEDLPQSVVDESKRLLLDSLGCAVNGHGTLKGDAGVRYGEWAGGGSAVATVIGGPNRSSVLGAAFANAELINARDFDTILPPGHVTPYVLPGILATAELAGASGKSIIGAIAVAHEISIRFGKAMDGLRDVKDGKPAMPPVFGYSSTIFGAVAGAAMVKGAARDTFSNALSIAGMTSPVNSFLTWCMHTPPTTLKYLSGGVLAQSALTALAMAEFGSTGNPTILDDEEHGYRQYIGTASWRPERILGGLRDEWLFPGELSYKPYPHARGSHGALDAVTSIVTGHDLAPEEITEIRAWGEAFAATYPVWRNREFKHVHDAQYSIPHAIAVCAHRIPVGREWQKEEVVFAPSVLELMNRTTFDAHPGYAEAVSANAARRPTIVEIDARGTTYRAECLYPKGSPSSDPSSTMTTDELVTKFRTNTDIFLAEDDADAVINDVLQLETLPDIQATLAALSPRADV